MTEDEKRAAGMLFYAEDEALLAQKQKAHRLSKDYSDTYDTEAEKRAAILKELLGAMGEGCVIGAGSVVTRDIPPMRFAAGVPCRVVRTIGPDDSMLQKPERLGGAQPLK